MTEITDRMKAKIYDLFEQSNALAEQQAEEIEYLHRRLSAAEAVCFTASGLLRSKPPLDTCYKDMLSAKLDRWSDVRNGGPADDGHRY